MKKILLFTAAIFLLLPACEINSLCTEEFRMIMLEVDGGDLDITVTRVKHDKRIAYTDSAAQGPHYLVLDDNYRYLFEGMTKAFVFYGYKNGSLVVEEEFIIAADECHISRVSGPEKISL